MDNIPRITIDTFLQVLDGNFDVNFDSKMIVDCRFEYEFLGGHIDGAENFNDKDEITEKLFSTPNGGKKMLIFHCEFSAHRAPMMAKFVRKHDRNVNSEQYPHLNFPEVYILDGGYSAFFKQQPSRCYPQNWVQMDDEQHAYTCEREMGRLRQTKKPLSRAQTFAFGQHDSPTAPSRSKSSNDDLMMLDSSPMFGGPGRSSPMFGHGAGAGHSRRMVSY